MMKRFPWRKRNAVNRFEARPAPSPVLLHQQAAREKAQKAQKAREAEAEKAQKAREAEAEAEEAQKAKRQARRAGQIPYDKAVGYLVRRTYRKPEHEDAAHYNFPLLISPRSTNLSCIVVADQLLLRNAK